MNNAKDKKQKDRVFETIAKMLELLNDLVEKDGFHWIEKAFTQPDVCLIKGNNKYSTIYTLQKCLEKYEAKVEFYYDENRKRYLHRFTE